VIAGIRGYSISELATSALLASAVVIIARFIWLYPATYLPRWLVPSIRRNDPSPPWQWPFALASAGVRGIVSLAAALAIPLVTATGQPFPNRNLILFLTFSVILVTLVGQGLALPSIIRALGLAKAGRRELEKARLEEREARRRAAQSAIERFDQLAIERDLAAEIAEPLRAAQRSRLLQVDLACDDSGAVGVADLHDEIELQLIEAERRLINDLFRDGQLNDEARRRIERDLDLREARVASRNGEG
jgi:hypothetical protein